MLCRHAIKKGFDHLPSYIAAKLAGSKEAKKHKSGSRFRAISASWSSRGSTGSGSPRGIQMTLRGKPLPEDRSVSASPSGRRQHQRQVKVGHGLQPMTCS